MCLPCEMYFQKPLWCAKYSGKEATCNDREYFFLGQLPYLTSVDSLIYEVIFCVYLNALKIVDSVTLY